MDKSRELGTKALLCVGLGLLGLGCSGAASTEEIPNGQTGVEESVPDFVSANATADQEANLLVRVYLSEGHVVEFYEPTPGNVVVSEAGRVPVLPIVGGLGRGQKITALDVFHAVAPDREIPSVLLEAMARKEACSTRESSAAPYTGVVNRTEAVTIRVEGWKDATGIGREPATDADDLSPTGVLGKTGSEPSSGRAGEPSRSTLGTLPGLQPAGSCSFSWFQAASSDGGRFCPTSGYYTWCLPNWMNGAFMDSGSWTDQTSGAVCADVGNVTLRVSGSGGVGTWGVPQGTWRQWYRFASGCCCIPLCLCTCDFTTRYDILDASGDRFQFGGVFQRFD